MPTFAGFGYLATVLDVFSRRIVGWSSMAESFFATLECELLDRHRFARLTDARYEIMSFIDWYNHRRRHTSLDNTSPVHSEENHQNSAHAAYHNLSTEAGQLQTFVR